MIIGPNFILEEIEFIRAFNAKQEQQIAEFSSNLEEHYQRYEVARVYENLEGVFQVENTDARQIEGISEEDYDVKALFTQDMPMYQRQAMLLTIWAVFESELILYLRYAEKELLNSAKLPTQIKGMSIFECILDGFKKLGAIKQPSKEFDAAFLFLNKKVRLVRNKWVHHAGIVDSEEQEELATRGIELSGSKLLISRDYIEEVVAQMKIIASELDSSIKPLILTTYRIDRTEG